MAPRNMLAISLPTSPSLSSPFTQALRQAISSHAADSHHPDAFASDIAQLVQLRSSVGAMEEHIASLECAYKYHAQLTFATTKLPSPLPLAFPWSQPMVSTSVFALGTSSGAGPATFALSSPPPEAGSSKSADHWARNESFGLVYDGQAYVGHPTLAWERANVLFAIAALLSSLGAQEPRNDGASLKRAVGFFQASSAVLSHLAEVIGPALLPDLAITSPPHGLSIARLRPLATLALAQAQECFWQKAVSDGMKPGTVAKLAKAVEDLYEQVAEEIKQAQVEDGVEALPRTWLNHVNVKKYHFGAAAQYRKSQDDLSNSRYGDEIARLQLAEAHIKSALSASKKGLPSSSDAIASDLKGLQGVVESNLKRSRKDNDLIYLEPVTTSGHLATIQGARMVQARLPVEVARPFDCLRAVGSAAPRGSEGDAPPALGKPLFGALVPYGAHVAVSIYEDRKERWWKDQIEAKRQELESLAKSTLNSLNLPAALDDLDRPQVVIPSQLISRAEEVVEEGGAAEVQRLCSEVQRISALNHNLLQEARGLLESEFNEDASIRQQFAQSKHWSRQASGVAGEGYWARLTELENTLTMAEESDNVVKGKIQRWSGAWQVLEGGEAAIAQSLPSGGRHGSAAQGRASSTITGSSPVVRELRGYLEGLDDALLELASLASETRSLVRSDDIRDKVMREVARLSAVDGPGQGGSYEEVDLGPEMFEGLFEIEFKKYRAIDREASTLEGKVESLLDRVRASSEAFRAQLAAASPLKAELSAHISELQAGAAKWLEVRSNLTEGLGFYNSLAAMITEFQQSCRDWNRARSIDIQGLVQQFSGTSLELRDRPWDASANMDNRRDVSSGHEDTTAAIGTPRRSARNAAAAKATPTTASPRGANARKSQVGTNGTGVDAEEGVSAQPSQQPPSNPQWGAWAGGQIRFGDE
ncbi:unnamed protein product [Parajaminaea phylloscopi]